MNGIYSVRNQVDNLFGRIGNSGLLHRLWLVSKFIHNRLEARGSAVPESEQMRLICLLLVTGITPATTGTVIPFAKIRYRKL